ncbi:MAG: ABC transporter ATP-binding protein [Ktedonobacteraceae bacterium]|nr:ABC transporter ATP-binding protein [Ktedonobacteraceae bacterium]
MQAAESTEQTTTQPAQPIIKIQHVFKRYRNVDALSDFSLEIPRGTIYGLIGPNGAGKTTLLRILAALISPTAGQVWLGDEEITRTPTTIQRKVGYMPDFFGVYPDLTSAEYLEFYAGIHGIPRQKRAQTVSDLLELVDLSSKRNSFVETLSRGMKQRLCLARALVHDPDVLLLDEPASGLDPRARVELRELVRALQGMGKTIIVSSHILPELAEMCTDIAIVQGGKLIASGDVDSVSHRLGSGRHLEIRILDLARVPEAMDQLKQLPGITNVTQGNGSSDAQLIQAEFSGDDQELHRILVALITHDIPVVSFAPRSGSGLLEEVFMSITEESTP